MTKSVTTHSTQKQHPLLALFTSSHWRKARAEYMQGARACKAALTNPNGCWRYDPTDPRVKKALEFWLLRARNAHAFALGRKPVIEKMVVINGDTCATGPLYATEKGE